MGRVVERDGSQGVEGRFALGVAAGSFDEQDQPIQLVLNLFGLRKLDRLAGSAGYADRSGPMAGQERELVHGFALDVRPRGGRGRLLRGERDTQCGEDGYSEQALAYRAVCFHGAMCEFHRTLLLPRGALSGLHCPGTASTKSTLNYRVFLVKRIF